MSSGAGTLYPPGTLEFTPGFSGLRGTRSLVYMFYRSLFVLLFFLMWSLRCLFLNLRILITPLVSLNYSYIF